MRSDRGSAVVEFVAVVPLLLLVGLAVVQLALLAHIQGVVDAAAQEGARSAAVSRVPQEAAQSAAEEVIADGLGELPITSLRTSRQVVSGMPVVVVQIEARPHLTMLPDFVLVAATGRALIEEAA